MFRRDYCVYNKSGNTQELFCFQPRDFDTSEAFSECTVSRYLGEDHPLIVVIGTSPSYYSASVVSYTPAFSSYRHNSSSLLYTDNPASSSFNYSSISFISYISYISDNPASSSFNYISISIVSNPPSFSIYQFNPTSTFYYSDLILQLYRPCSHGLYPPGGLHHLPSRLPSGQEEEVEDVDSIIGFETNPSNPLHSLSLSR